jgi:hypothetical protein
LESPRQHDLVRNEHAQMMYSLFTVKMYLRKQHRKDITAEQIVAINKHLDFLEHVLEFSATWNGVPTMLFFPELSNIKSFLQKNDMLRLGGFFSKPFFQVSKDLHQIGGEYPFLLKKLYEAYYVRTLRKSAVSAV